tara:strand:+ start:1473 stop:1865 length:393 start_codon:yes stop_codon:yes gene_type:complete
MSVLDSHVARHLPDRTLADRPGDQNWYVRTILDDDILRNEIVIQRIEMDAFEPNYLKKMLGINIASLKTLKKHLGQIGIDLKEGDFRKKDVPKSAGSRVMSFLGRQKKRKGRRSPRASKKRTRTQRRRAR